MESNELINIREFFEEYHIETLKILKRNFMKYKNLGESAFNDAELAANTFAQHFLTHRIKKSSINSYFKGIALTPENSEIIIKFIEKYEPNNTKKHAWIIFQDMSLGSTIFQWGLTLYALEYKNFKDGLVFSSNIRTVSLTYFVAQETRRSVIEDMESQIPSMYEETRKNIASLGGKARSEKLYGYDKERAIEQWVSKKWPTIPKAASDMYFQALLEGNPFSVDVLTITKWLREYKKTQA